MQGLAPHLSLVIMPPRRFLTSCPAALVPLVLLPLACHDTPTEPSVPTEPAIRIESPIAGATLNDTIVVLRGVAEAPGAVDEVGVSSPTNPGPAGTSIFRSQEGATPDATIHSPNRVPFEVRLNVWPGQRPLTVSMTYRLKASDQIWGANPTMTVVVPIRIWRKPALRVERGPSDTVYGRSLSLRASVAGIDSTRQFELVVDEGAANERRAPNRGDWSDPIGPGQPGVDSASWRRVELPDTLGDGPHTYVLRLRDEMGLVDSVRGAFVTYVAPEPYTLAALPTLGGTDAEASDINTAGDIVGWALDAAARQTAVVWRAGQASALPDLAPATTKSWASALNDAGDIAGTTSDNAGYHAVRWRGGSVSTVGAPASGQWSIGVDINANGDVLGTYDYRSAFIDRSGAVSAIPMAQPVAFNDRGQVVGSWASFANGFTSPAVYGIPMPSDIGFRFGTVGKARTSAGSINNSSIVLGAMVADFSGTTYFLSLGTPPSIDLTTALGGPFGGLDVVRITDNGTVLAFDRRSHTAYRWRAGRTTRVTVGTPGWTLDRVTGMNDAGDIVGHATETSTGRTAAVRLQPAR